MKSKLRVKQVKSTIGVDWRFRLNLKGLGLGPAARSAAGQAPAEPVSAALPDQHGFTRLPGLL